MLGKVYSVIISKIAIISFRKYIIYTNLLIIKLHTKFAQFAVLYMGSWLILQLYLLSFNDSADSYLLVSNSHHFSVTT